MTNPRPIAATVLSVIAVVIALCGTSLAGYAVGKASGDSIIKKNSLSGNRLKPDTVTGKQVKESSLGKVASAKTADSVPAPVLHPYVVGAHWSVFTTTRGAGYRVDASGFVHLQGLLTIDDSANQNEVLLTLPPGTRPSFTITAQTADQQRINITSTGEVYLIDSTVDLVGVSLEGVVFYPDK